MNKNVRNDMQTENLKTYSGHTQTAQKMKWGDFQKDMVFQTDLKKVKTSIPHQNLCAPSTKTNMSRLCAYLMRTLCVPYAYLMRTLCVPYLPQTQPMPFTQRLLPNDR